MSYIFQYKTEYTRTPDSVNPDLAIWNLRQRDISLFDPTVYKCENRYWL